MKIHILSLFILCSFLVSPSFALTNQEMKKVCSDKTIVFNKKGEKIGYKLSAYCVGYLKGVLETLIATDPKVCQKDANSGFPEYLLSIYETYMEEKDIKNSEEASITIIKAFKRAFTCE